MPGCFNFKKLLAGTICFSTFCTFFGEVIIMSIASLRVLVVKNAYECQGWTLVQLRCFRHRRCVSKSTPKKQSFINPNKWYTKKSQFWQESQFSPAFFSTPIWISFSTPEFFFWKKIWWEKIDFMGLLLWLARPHPVGYWFQWQVASTLRGLKKWGEGQRTFYPLGVLQFYMFVFL